MQYFSDKVVQVEGKYYTSCEKLSNIENKESIVLVRQVAKISKTYEHPVNGPYTMNKFDMVRGAGKIYMPEETWNSLPDSNEDNLKVELGSFK